MATNFATTMTCPHCEALLELLRSCGRVRMECRQCRQRFQIHEVAHRLDAQTEEMLAGWNSIIYD